MTSSVFAKDKTIRWTSENKKECLDWLSQELGIQSSEDWYKVTLEDLNGKEVSGLLHHHYNDSIYRAVVSEYAQFVWNPWMFAVPPKGWNSDEKVQRQFFDWLSDTSQLRNKEDWYSLDPSEVIQRGGESILNKYDGSLSRALQRLYPEYRWQSWKFRPRVSSSLIQKHRNYFDSMALSLGIETLEDWYNYTCNFNRKVPQMKNILKYYDQSLVRALTHVYPEHNWQVWRFKQVPKSYWTDQKNMSNYFDWLSNKLKLDEERNWESISVKQVCALGATFPLRKWGGMREILSFLHIASNLRKIPVTKSQQHVLHVLQQTLRDYNTKSLPSQ